MGNNKETMKTIVFIGKLLLKKSKNQSVFLKSHNYYIGISPFFILKEMNWFSCFQFYPGSAFHWGLKRIFLKQKIVTFSIRKSFYGCPTLTNLNSSVWHIKPTPFHSKLKIWASFPPIPCPYLSSYSNSNNSNNNNNNWADPK